MTSQNSKPVGLGALAQRLIIAHTKLKSAEQAVEDLKAELNATKDQVLAEFAANRVTSIKYRGFTVYSKLNTYGSLVSTQGDEDPKAAAIAALKKNDLGWMVKQTVNGNTLSAWVREQPVDPKTGVPQLPPKVAPFVKVSQKPDVGIKQS